MTTTSGTAAPTPGPILRDGTFLWQLDGPDGANLWSGSLSPNNGHAEYHALRAAQLLETAPLMLEALKTLHDKTAELIAHLQSTDRLRPCFNLPAIETARSAIAAATGAQGGTR